MIETANFKKSGVQYDSVWFNKPPHKTYTAERGKTLADLKRGNPDIIDSDWIGYQKNHFSVTFQLKEEAEISSIAIGTLTIPTFLDNVPQGM